MEPLKSIPDAVDAFGRIKARASKLAEDEAAVRAFFVEEYKADKSRKAFNGNLFRTTVSEYDQDTVDKDAVIAKLASLMEEKAFKAFIRRNTETKTVIKVSVKARIVETVAAEEMEAA